MSMKARKMIDTGALLRQLDACRPGVNWVEQFARGKSARALWFECNFANWLLWLAEMVEVDLAVSIAADDAVICGLECRPLISNKALADIVRKHIPWSVVRRGIERLR